MYACLFGSPLGGQHRPIGRGSKKRIEVSAAPGLPSSTNKMLDAYMIGGC